MELLRVVWGGGCVPDGRLRECVDSSEVLNSRQMLGFIFKREGHLHLQLVEDGCG